MIELYKMINGLYDEEVLPKFDMREDVVYRGNKGHSKQIFITRSSKDLRANFFTKRAAPVWNKLTEEFVSAPSADCFKRRLDALWDNHPMKYDYTQSVFSFN